MVAANNAPMETVFSSLIQELQEKITQLELNISQGHSPTRRELEVFIWKTGRVVRLLVKPEASSAREIFWSECKGILKKVINIEKFNPGVFTSECVLEEVMESHLLATLKKFQKYTRQRLTGEIEAPREILTMESAAKRAKKQEEDQEKAKKDEEEEWWKKEDAKWSNWTDDGGKRWDDEASDPEEACPDKAKYGNCSYGIQCGFCHRE